MVKFKMTSFRNKDGSIALVVLNRTEDAKDFLVKVGDKAFKTDIPCRAIQTYLIGK